MQTHIRLLRQTARPDVVSAYFEPYLYMLKVNCLITAVFHAGESQTLDDKVAGLILKWGAVLCP